GPVELEEIATAHTQLAAVRPGRDERPLRCPATLVDQPDLRVDEAAVRVDLEEASEPVAHVVASDVALPVQLRPERGVVAALVGHVLHEQVGIVAIPRLAELGEEFPCHRTGCLRRASQARDAVNLPPAELEPIRRKWYRPGTSAVAHRAGLQALDTGRKAN